MIEIVFKIIFVQNIYHNSDENDSQNSVMLNRQCS